ncbi:MAG TPA: MBL fold metallo-hydrolase [Candidatus Thermoplasmatota archaeon]|jgi:7,8-dihydropterin-6-yl-methyl-4-(beta-D-ribofuranosyl)aminobenzene 5'-phosphate synthase|nr:MBL fold metallo-hydrolase [Candidatus Thermoplasmatota archaeon]
MADLRHPPVERLAAADRADVLVVVDNATDSLSTNPPDVRAELPQLVERGMKEWAGEHMGIAHHGLSLLVTAHHGDRRSTILFDAGPEGYAFERNARQLHADLGAAEALVLSHGHWDHSGGLLRAVELIRKASGREVPVHVHPGMFRRRGMRMPSGAVVPFQDVPTPAQIEGVGGRVHAASAPQLLGGGAFFLSGEIPRVTIY